MVKVLENVVYEEGYGVSGTLDLYYSNEGACKVLLIYLHGGGLETGDKSDQKEIYKILAENGIAVVSANYRMYPQAKYPEYIEDAAKAVKWSLEHVKEYVEYDYVFIGGISAGSYMSMMLHFQPAFLEECGVCERDIAGYIFDSGQPTVHYRILQERGMDPSCIRVDEAAPIFYLEGEKKPNEQAFLVIVSDKDVPGRREQNELLMRTMEAYNYNKERITYIVKEGYEHTGYVGVKNEDGSYPYADLLISFIKSNI